MLSFAKGAIGSNSEAICSNINVIILLGPYYVAKKQTATRIPSSPKNFRMRKIMLCPLLQQNYAKYKCPLSANSGHSIT